MAIDYANTVEVKVRSWDGYSPFPESLEEMLSFLEEARAEIPEEYRDAAVFECRASASWEDSAVVVGEITYRRRKTEEEKIAEANTAKARSIAEARRREEEERAAYEVLKRKYG